MKPDAGTRHASSKPYIVGWHCIVAPVPADRNAAVTMIRHGIVAHIGSIARLCREYATEQAPRFDFHVATTWRQDAGIDERAQDQDAKPHGFTADRGDLRIRIGFAIRIRPA